jgi:hypothetical protein
MCSTSSSASPVLNAFSAPAMIARIAASSSV